MRPEHRIWRVAEIVQTSSMDCGPAALSALLRGHGIAADYGRLREACQTDVDGTSIDVIERVLNQLGLVAEQVMLPVDRLFTDLTPSLPALAVTKLADGAPHFIVVWRKLGPWLQVMDPAEGRRWLRRKDLLPRLLRHKLSVPATDWLEWARGPEGLAPLQQRLAALGMSSEQVSTALAPALADPMWFALAAVEACLRLVEALTTEGALSKGPAAVALWRALLHETRASEDDIYRLVPPAFWSVEPDPDSARQGQRHLVMDGAVLVRIAGHGPQETALPPDLQAAIAPAGPGVWRMLWRWLWQDGVTAPLLLMAGLMLAIPGALAEAVSMRLLMGTSSALASPLAREALIGGTLGLMLALLAMRMALGAETLRAGRRIELRLRMALLAKLPRLHDRYQASRPVSDMADRAQSLYLLRQIPGMALHLVQSCAELALTAGGLVWLDPTGLWLVVSVVLAALALPFLSAATLAEGEMALRTKGSAVAGVTFDVLRGQSAIKAHRAETILRQRHEALLTGWAQAARRLTDRAALVGAVRQAIVLALVAVLILRHVGPRGLDLLYLWWALKLPGAGADLAGLIRQIPAQRAIVSRLVEPLTAPDRADIDARGHLPPGPLGLRIVDGRVVAGGHEVLRDINLTIVAGEHLAIVGPSGSGKSSLLGLFLGSHGLAEGQLLVNGQPLHRTGFAALRHRTAWVDPGVQVWNDSLAANARFANPDATPEELGAAFRAADLLGLAKRLPGGILASVGEGGGLLSGGEGQRLRFARALLQPEIGLAVLDEPFRGLDRSARSALLAEARRHWRGATMLWVTHDLAEVMSFDRVLVVEDGTVVEDGRPVDLARRTSRFAALLHADKAATETLWGRSQWHRLWMEDGHVRHRD